MRAEEIMHPNDAKAIQCMQNLKGFNTLVKVYMKLGGEALHRGMNLGGMMRVTEENNSRVYRLLKEACEKIGIKMPDLYIFNDMDKYFKKAADLIRQLSTYLVEMRGIEPLSENSSARFSPSAVIGLGFPSRTAQ